MTPPNPAGRSPRLARWLLARQGIAVARLAGATLFLAALGCGGEGGRVAPPMCELACPPGDRCVAGRCVPSDAGTLRDGGPADAPVPVDAGLGAGVEVCNDRDDDDDGTVDEGCPCPAGTSRECYGGPGELAGVGACVLGEQRCDENGEFGAVWSECEGFGRPARESCGNGFDDDCNGETDEGCLCEAGEERECYPGADGTAGVGLCQAGTQRCVGPAEGWAGCTGHVTPVREACGDGSDNDCDGQTDCADADCTGQPGCETCTPGEERFDVTPASAEMLILADRSDSMLQLIDGSTSAWNTLVGALEAVLPPVDGTHHLGVMTFPSGAGCAVGAAPEVPIQRPSANAILERLRATGPGPGGTPMMAAVQSARAYLEGLPASARPRYLLLATDGLPACGGDVASVAAELESLRAMTGIETFVLGIAEGGYFIEDPVFRENLNTLADAGGRARSGDPRYYAAGNLDEFERTLVGISAAAASCRFEVQRDPSSTSALSVTLDDTPIPRGRPDGWTLDGTTLELHGSACERLTGGTTRTLSVASCQ